MVAALKGVHCILLYIPEVVETVLDGVWCVLEVVEAVLEVLEGVRYVLGAVKDVQRMLKELEVVLKVLKVVLYILEVVKRRTTCTMSARGGGRILYLGKLCSIRWMLRRIYHTCCTCMEGGLLCAVCGRGCALSAWEAGGCAGLFDGGHGRWALFVGGAEMMRCVLLCILEAVEGGLCWRYWGCWGYWR